MAEMAIKLTPGLLGPMGASLLSISEYIASLGDASQGVINLLGGFIDRTDDLRDLIRCECLANSTGGTLELVSIKVLPSETFFELISTITVEREDVSVVLRHGWPILSVATDSATVTTDAGESIS